MTVLAHTGHWYHSLLYAAPIVLIALALWWSGRRDRTGAAGKHPGPGREPAAGEGEGDRDA